VVHPLVHDADGAVGLCLLSFCSPLP
jgi:hypothetical protein